IQRAKLRGLLSAVDVEFSADFADVRNRSVPFIDLARQKYEMAGDTERQEVRDRRRRPRQLEAELGKSGFDAGHMRTVEGKACVCSAGGLAGSQPASVDAGSGVSRRCDVAPFPLGRTS